MLIQKAPLYSKWTKCSWIKLQFSFYFFLGQKKLFECSHSFPLHLLYCYILWHHTVLPRRSLWCHEKGLRSSRRCDTERKCLYVFKHYGNCKRAFQNCQKYMLWKDECLCGINSSCYTCTLECVVFSHWSLEPSISNGIWHTTPDAKWGLSKVRCVFFVPNIIFPDLVRVSLMGVVLLFWNYSPGSATAHLCVCWCSQMLIDGSRVPLPSASR